MKGHTMSSGLLPPRLMPLRPLPVRLAGLLVATLVAVGAAGKSAQALYDDDDRAMLAACLDLVKKNQAARGPSGLDPLKEKAGPAGRLAAAQAAAPRQEESCIGAVATACVHEQNDDSTSALIQCYGREADAWDARLNKAFKALMADKDDKDAVENLRKTERIWITFRDASCAQYALVFKGNTVGPMGNQCVMEMTARQALWLEEWLR
jgi:uncharacterized protein YecT (DUF1311 family)